MIEKIIQNYVVMLTALKMDPLFQIDSVSPGTITAGPWAHAPWGDFTAPGKLN